MFPIPVTMTVAESQQQFTLDVEESVQNYEMTTETELVYCTYPKYEGPVEVTPTRQQQILHTKNTHISSDIVVNPIPKNYGLITWNGQILTVS